MALWQKTFPTGNRVELKITLAIQGRTHGMGLAGIPPPFTVLHRFRPLLLLVSLVFVGCIPPPPPAEPGPSLAAIAPLPTDLIDALNHFRAEGPKGWAFTQRTTSEGRERVERYNPRLRGPARWTLLSDKGAPPTEAEQQRYRDTRPPFDSAANLASQLERAAATLISQDARTTTYEFRLRPVSENDKAAPFMRARFTLDHPTGAITRVELFNFAPFKPATSLTIHEARTTLAYSLPAEGRPALPREVTMHVHGERFWFFDFDETVVSRYTDHENVSAVPVKTE